MVEHIWVLSLCFCQGFSHSGLWKLPRPMTRQQNAETTSNHQINGTKRTVWQTVNSCSRTNRETISPEIRSIFYRSDVPFFFQRLNPCSLRNSGCGQIWQNLKINRLEGTAQPWRLGQCRPVPSLPMCLCVCVYVMQCYMIGNVNVDGMWSSVVWCSVGSAMYIM